MPDKIEWISRLSLVILNETDARWDVDAICKAFRQLGEVKASTIGQPLYRGSKRVFQHDTLRIKLFDGANKLPDDCISDALSSISKLSEDTKNTLRQFGGMLQLSLRLVDDQGPGLFISTVLMRQLLDLCLEIDCSLMKWDESLL